MSTAPDRPRWLFALDVATVLIVGTVTAAVVGIVRTAAHPLLIRARVHRALRR